ncbi:aminodeoxychorismate synthase component I [Arthrobacter sp. ATA002]|uniref:aminodeoxychorismate synthase component I n=1 Tax=Arthrobacter sp. ATA002 TaxID=2991715 RepID=UPI0022A799F7|nr:aminodeoxychorismate synthase component I [Arthrobacter sp. ATA002]WAP52312.1 aminodeoxychorismate synthase component I [Arthrobacter sp. ATA002]
MPPPSPTAAGTAALPVMIAVDGFSGAGKTTLAIELAAALRAHHRVSLFHLEDIYPGWDGLAEGIAYYCEKVAAPLAAGRPAVWRAWDWEAGSYGPPRSTAPAEIIILEGVGATAAGAGHLLDAAVWVSAPAGLRREQALERDGDTYAPHWERWAAQERRWAAADPAAARADITVDRQHRHGTPAEAAGYVLRALAGLQLPRLQLSRPEAGAAGAVRVDRLEMPPEPAELFAALYADSPRAVWLDSSSAASPAPAAASGSAHITARSRYSIMADDGGPHGRYAEHRGGVTTIVSGPVSVSRPGPFFQWLDTVWGEPRAAVPRDYPCGFALGWVGFLGYELKRETGGADLPAPDGAPDAALLFTGRAVVLDHELDCLYALTLDDDGGAWAGRVRRAVHAAVSAGPGLPRRPAPPAPQFSVRDSRTSYQAKVRSAQQEITDGNSYEVCLTTSLSARLPNPPDGAQLLELYRELRKRSPAPFASLLRFGSFTLAGTSPERFLSIAADGRLRAEPIEGTRPRGATAEEDRRLEEDLVSSLKDRAENVMIVDLLRNDLSRSAVPGSVAVPRLFAVESYATVHQLVSTVDARLLPEASRAEAVAAAFPPGSMTGAPKISTMAILDRLEGAPRGPYSGVAGWFSLSGAADLSVVIRTLGVQGSSLTLGVGGAVTADSDPAAEWEEVRAKAFGVLSALGSRFPD